MPKYSIVIPVRNAFDYARCAVESALIDGRDDVEVLVSDNHSTVGSPDDLGERILDDPRVRVLRPQRALSMTAHFNFALTSSTGEWVTALGSDDALMPHFYQTVDRYLGAVPDTRALLSRRALYFWPGCERIYGTNAVVADARARSGWVDSRAEADRILRGHTSYFDSLQLYTGSVVHRSAVEAVRQQTPTGQFYEGTQPDMHSTFALLAVLPRFFRTEIPVAWAGTSVASNGFANSDADSSNSIATEFWRMGAAQDSPSDPEFEFGPRTPYRLHVLQSAVRVSRWAQTSDVFGLAQRTYLSTALAAVLRLSEPSQRSMVLESAQRLGFSPRDIERRALTARMPAQLARGRAAAHRRLSPPAYQWNIQRLSRQDVPTVSAASDTLAHCLDWNDLVTADPVI